MVLLLPVSVALKMFFFLLSGLYRGMWRYTGLSDLWKIGRAVFMAEVALILYVVFASSTFTAIRAPSSSWTRCLAFVFACGARVLIRSLYEISSHPKDWLSVLPAREVLRACRQA
jgi:FlaA1/EpsC-like NDP-sugar epimerase